MAPITLENVTKVYPNGFEAVHELDLSIAEGEFMVLVGPSGCGKTTVLRMIAGLEDVTSGTIRIGDRVVNDVASRDRDIAMVFQNYALYPHMTVAQNIGYALKLRKVPKGEVKKRVAAAAHVLGLTEWLDRKPGQLSGGQRQRVAMGRAIVREPSAFLMDEPLSNLDAKLRVQMRAEVARIQHRLGVATLYVTHDQTEAMTMGERVAVMRAGALQACEEPQVLYDRPVNLFVAAFIGSPAMNLFEGDLAPDAAAVRLGNQSLQMPESVLALHPRLRAFGGRRIVVGVRPEDLPAAPAGFNGACLEGEVDLIEALGSELQIHFKIDARPVRPEDTGSGDDAGDEEAGDFSSLGTGVARVDPRVTAKLGQPFRFMVKTDRLQFFDLVTGLAIWA
ncbi:MAG TPA: sn-glycerol-3-phosphate ABC transporter ATP-binding protein UgpC [Acidimicrobiales bacterium]|nr:sn-glycerol-3-phosphate ABC transporter ATP-binding protein UgpC [Acidimicrobiales bacterium]